MTAEVLKLCKQTFDVSQSSTPGLLVQGTDPLVLTFRPAVASDEIWKICYQKVRYLELDKAGWHTSSCVLIRTIAGVDPFLYGILDLVQCLCIPPSSALGRAIAS